jgi:hypothetical protein
MGAIIVIPREQDFENQQLRTPYSEEKILETLKNQANCQKLFFKLEQPYIKWYFHKESWRQAYIIQNIEVVQNIDYVIDAEHYYCIDKFHRT